VAEIKKDSCGAIMQIGLSAFVRSRPCSPSEQLDIKLNERVEDALARRPRQLNLSLDKAIYRVAHVVSFG